MNNKYIGSRYIPEHKGLWDNTKNTAYESLQVVYYQGKSYTSKKAVPAGIDINDDSYWALSADYNEQFAIFKSDTTALINSMNDQVSELATVSITKYKDLAVNVGLANEDWSAALQTANDYIKNTFTAGILLIPFDIQVMQPFNWTCDRVMLKGNHSTITFNINDTTKYGIYTYPKLFATANNVMVESLNFAGVNETCNGLDFFNDTIGVCNLIFLNVNVSGFLTGLTINKNAYIPNFIGCNFYSCTKIIDAKDAVNSGERISFTNCTLANSSNGISCENGNADIYFTNCSLDYITNNIITLTAGHVYFNNSHIEFRLSDYTPTRKPFIMSGTSILSIRASYIGCTSNYNPNTLDYLVDNNTTGGGRLIIDNCYISWLPLVGYAAGTGKTIVNDTYSNNASMDMPKISSENNNILIDGDFEYTMIMDDIRNDSSAITPTLTTEEHYTGSKCLQIQKIGTGGNFDIYIPLRKLNNVAFRMYMKSTVADNSIGYMSQFVNLKSDGTLHNSLMFGSSSIDLTTPFDWKLFSAPILNYNIPKWATHLRMHFDFSTVATTLKFYIDHLICTES